MVQQNNVNASHLQGRWVLYEHHLLSLLNMSVLVYNASTVWEMANRSHPHPHAVEGIARLPLACSFQSQFSIKDELMTSQQPRVGHSPLIKWHRSESSSNLIKLSFFNAQDGNDQHLLRSRCIILLCAHRHRYRHKV